MQEQYHCQECKKAVWRDRIQMAPGTLFLLYIAFAPRPFPPNAVTVACVLFTVSFIGLLFYFKRHP